jgi:hypothetical protein
MPSKLKSDTARLNGSKSRGPITPEGKAKSAPNATRHGLRAQSVIVTGESPDDFKILLDAYLDAFEPQGIVEYHAVESMAIARWRLDRIVGIETNILRLHLADRRPVIDRSFRNIGDNHRVAWVFKDLAERGPSLALIIRYEAALNRTYHRAFKQLLELQSARKQEQPNEPKPSVPPPQPPQTLPQNPTAPQPEVTALDPKPAPTAPLSHCRIREPQPVRAGLSPYTGRRNPYELVRAL